MPVTVVYNHLPRCAAACLERAPELSQAVAEVMRDGAQAAVPVLTGALRTGIQLEGTGGTEVSVTASSIAGGATREYSQYVEYGTRHASSQPFMMPGFVAGVASVPVKGRTEFGAYIEAAA